MSSTNPTTGCCSLVIPSCRLRTSWEGRQDKKRYLAEFTRLLAERAP